jgi:hypothetical protein
MHRKEIIDAPMQKIQKIVKDLTIGKPAHDMVKTLLSEANSYCTLEDLKKEWLNDVLSKGVSSNALSSALEDPDSNFISFAIKFIDSPDEPSERIINKMSKQYGEAFVGHFLMVVWPVQIAWAQRLRNHQDDHMCICADIFVKLLAKKGPSKIFCDLTNWSFKNGIEAISNNPSISEMSKEEILSAPLDNMDFIPICISFVKNQSKNTLSRISEKKFTEHAKSIREQYQDDYLTTELSNTVKYLQDFPIIFRHMIVMQVLSLGITSNAYHWLNEKFIQDIKSMRITSAPEFIDREFSRFVNDHEKDAKKFSKASKSEVIDLRQEVSLLSAKWQKSLPYLTQELGAEKSSNFSKWRDQILDNYREAPRDPSLDFFMWLVGKKYSVPTN